MSTLLAAIASPFAPYIAAAVVAVLAALGFKRAGRKEAIREAELKDKDDALEIRKSADQARAAADRGNAGDGLRQPDPWKRD